MFAFMTKAEEKTAAADRAERLTAVWQIMKDIYRADEITDERREQIENLVNKYGYLPVSQIMALRELNAADVFCGLEAKWALNGVFKDGEFKFNFSSAPERAGFNTPDWIKREQHNIKLINLAASGNGNYSSATGNFIDFLKQILILPVGNSKEGVLGDTIYLIPFHNRDFGCAYLPVDSDVSKFVKDNYLCSKTGISAKEQIKIFVEFAGLAGHPVIYDILPQTARFSKAVFAHPEIARWFDVNKLISQNEKAVDEACVKFEKEYDPEDVRIVSNILKDGLFGGSNDVAEHFKPLYEAFENYLEPIQKRLSEKMCTRKEQNSLREAVCEIIKNIEGKMPSCEEDVKNQGIITSTLIENNYWPAPGGAWCSSGVPVFVGMAQSGDYPIFKHFDRNGRDVSDFANLDCQTPYYFTFLENGKLNEPVVNIFVNSVKELCDYYNFDGIRLDHADHIVDEFSVEGNRPMSYRIPAKVAKKLNSELKKDKKYFASLAEYMLGGNYLKEYNKDMGFDLLWGNDIIAQSTKNPRQIMLDNEDLKRYNNGKNSLSILKTYNNQDGEFREINQYPGQLGEEGALFKWFKMKFIPGGKGASRPVLYVDGDESFTTVGTEDAIISEVSLCRNDNREFFRKFDAINRFAANNVNTLYGKAKVVTQNDKGFSCWIINNDVNNEVLFIVANCNSPTEFVRENGETVMKQGFPVYSESVELPDNYNLLAEFVYNCETGDFERRNLNGEDKFLCFDKLEPSEFRIFELCKQ